MSIFYIVGKDGGAPEEKADEKNRCKNESETKSKQDKEISELKTEEELTYLKKTDYLAKIILTRISENPEHGFSKQLLTLSFHYFALGLYAKAEQMLREVRLDYFVKQIFDDLDRSIYARNKADESIRKKDLKKAHEFQIEARFFIVIIEMLPFLRQQKALCRAPEFAAFLKRLGQKPFIVQLAPYIGNV